MPVPLIGDVVEACSSEEFRSDVQLVHYRSEHNVSLAGDYIFTRKAAAGRLSSVDLLRKIVDSLQSGTRANRYCFIASYGHGKSHFALALANFFGEPLGSPGFSAVMGQLEHAIGDEGPLFGGLQAYKQNHRPSFVIILKGDEPTDLHTKFFAGVSEALENTGLGREVIPPFWYEGARKALVAIDPLLRGKADGFLASYDLDVDTLLEKIEHQEYEACGIAAALCGALYNVTPDFYSSAGLGEAVKWLTNCLCGEEGPYSSILVLFDEFSAFVRDYAIGDISRQGTPLQDLLNGIEQCMGSAAFVAFAPRRPIAIAESILAGQDDALDSVMKELTRIPHEFQLHSSLEEVLDAYLRQRDSAWPDLLRDPTFLSQVGMASDLAFERFAKRYGSDLGWDIEHFQETVTLGCYPFHPMTTALLCSVELQVAPAARTVLGFVLSELDRLKQEPVMVEGRTNWVLPVRLVQYFGGMLGADLWRDYSAALEQAGGPDAPPEHVGVLQAVLLQRSGEVQTKRAFDAVIGQFAGLDAPVATQALRDLAKNGVIRHDIANRVYGFWPHHSGLDKLLRALAHKTDGIVLNATALAALTSELRRRSLLRPHQISVSWGHYEDWVAEQFLVAPSALTPSSVRSLVDARIGWSMDGQEKARGAVLLVVAGSSEQVTEAQSNAASVLVEAFAEEPPPVVVICPRVAHPDLAHLLLQLYGLTLFANPDKVDVGQEQYDTYWNNLCDQIGDALKTFLDDAEKIVHPAFTAHILAAKPKTTDSLLLELFKMAYRDGPRDWFSQYKLSQTRSRSEYALLVRHLLTNSLDSEHVLDARPVARDALNQFLRGKWGLMGPDLRITEPGSESAVRAAWDLLDSGFPVAQGSVRVSCVLEPLLRTPYGYDWNTLALVFAAWFGLHRNDLQLSVGGRIESITTLAEDGKKGGFKIPKDFLLALAPASVERFDPDAAEEEVSGILRRVDEGSFTQDEARQTLVVLEEYLLRDGASKRPAANAAVERVSRSLERAQEYDQRVKSLLSNQAAAKELRVLAGHLKAARNLPILGLVRPMQPEPEQVVHTVLGNVKEIAQDRCSTLIELTDFKRYEHQRQQLYLIQKALEDMELPELLAVAREARERLDLALEALEMAQEDERNLSVIRALSGKGHLSELRDHLKLLDGTTAHTLAGTQETAQKRALIHSEIVRLEHLAGAFPEKIANAVTPGDLAAVRDQLVGERWAFEGTSELELIKRAEAAIEVLGPQLAVVEEARVAHPASTNEVKTLVDRLEGLGGTLSPAQVQARDAVVAGLRGYELAQIGLANLWLEDAASQAKSGNGLLDLVSVLESTPPFLPDEERPRLNSLRQEVRGMIEEDELLQVKEHFGRIGNIERQRQCLKELAALIEDTSQS